MQEDASGLYFDFNKSFLENYEIKESEIQIQVRDFAILGGYPGIELYTRYPKCILVYKNVSHSKRTVAEYLDTTRQQFGKRYEIIDSNFTPTDEMSYMHFLDLVSEELNAYISWEIIASAVEVKELE